MQRARAFGFNYDTHTHTKCTRVLALPCASVLLCRCVGAAPVLVCVEKNLRNMLKHKRDVIVKQQKE